MFYDIPTLVRVNAAKLIALQMRRWGFWATVRRHAKRGLPVEQVLMALRYR